MEAQARRVLVIGYGNPGRADDGLGPALAAAIEAMGLPGVTVEANYQLAVEDSALVAEHDVTVIVDATTAGPDPFTFGPLEPAREVAFSTHSMSPGGVLALAREHFGSTTPAYLLQIRGHEFDRFEERLTKSARANLARAVEFLAGLIRTRTFDDGRFASGGDQ